MHEGRTEGQRYMSSILLSTVTIVIYFFIHSSNRTILIERLLCPDTASCQGDGSNEADLLSNNELLSSGGEIFNELRP